MGVVAGTQPRVPARDLSFDLVEPKLDTLLSLHIKLTFTHVHITLLGGRSIY